tara:strand:+ start:116 stop:289 length:174 start_codon:yes stop_codon:yes gene_type:complete
MSIPINKLIFFFSNKYFKIKKTPKVRNKITETAAILKILNINKITIRAKLLNPLNLS